jgi:hypothetical protein
VDLYPFFKVDYKMPSICKLKAIGIRFNNTAKTVLKVLLLLENHFVIEARIR